MKSRLQELAEQAGMYVDLDGKPWPKWMGAEECEVAYAKFAELIVEECRYVMDCNKGSDQNPVWNQALSETSEKIKQHFGVEE